MKQKGMKAKKMKQLPPEVQMAPKMPMAYGCGGKVSKMACGGKVKKGK